MKKLSFKTLAFIVVAVIAIVASSCDDPDFQEGFKQGWEWSTSR